MKGKLPITQMMTLESEESQWWLLIRNLINDLKTSALVEIEPGRKVRIQLVIDQIIPPEYTKTKNQCMTQTNLGEKAAIGISKSKEFLSDFLDKTTWIFMGYIDGDEKTPILIVYYQSINITIYTQKLKGETNENFFPQPSASVN